MSVNRKLGPKSVFHLLKKRKWGGVDAVDYFYNRLTGDDGAPAWTLEEAADELKKKLKLPQPVACQRISEWRKIQRTLRAQKENLKLANQALLQFVAEGGEDIDLEQLSEALLTHSLSQVFANEEPDTAIAATKAVTSLLKALTDKEKLKQRRTEHEESVAKLKATIERLVNALKKKGVDDDTINELNRKVADTVDEMILSRSQ